MRPAVFSGKKAGLLPEQRQKIMQLACVALEIILAREFWRLRPSFWLRRAPNGAVAYDDLLFLQDATNREELFSLLTEKVKIFSFQKIRM